jgi:hypothetical protein
VGSRGPSGAIDPGSGLSSIGATGPAGAGLPETLSLTVPLRNPESGPWFYMPERDWHRFGAHLKALGEFSSAAHDAFLLFLGAGIAGAVAVVVWIGQLSQTKDPTTVFLISGVILIVSTIAVFIMAFVSNTQDTRLKKRLRRDADLLYDDMDSVQGFPKYDGDKP